MAQGKSFGDYFAESMNSVGLSTPAGIADSAGTVIGHVGALVSAWGTVQKLGNPSIAALLREVAMRSPSTFSWISRLWPNLANRLAAMRVSPQLAGAGAGAAEVVGVAAAAYAAFYIGALLGAMAYAMMKTTGIDPAGAAASGFFNWYYGIDKLEKQNKLMERKLEIMRQIKAQALQAKVQIPPGQLSKMAEAQMANN